MACETSHIFRVLSLFAVLAQVRRTNNRHSLASHGKMDEPIAAMRPYELSLKKAIMTMKAGDSNIIVINGRLAVVVRDERPAYPFVTVRWMAGRNDGKENEVIAINFLDEAASVSQSLKDKLDPDKKVQVTVTNNQTVFDAALSKLGAKDFPGPRFEEMRGVSGTVSAILWRKGLVWLSGRTVSGWVPINALLGFETVTWNAGEEALLAGSRSEDNDKMHEIKRLRRSSFNMDGPPNSRKHVFVDNLDACKRKCVEDVQCLAIKYRSAPVYYDMLWVNCLICYRQGDTQYEPDSPFQTWTKIPPEVAYQMVSLPCGDADIEDVSSGMQEPGTISDCSNAVHSHSNCKTQVFWHSYLHRVCKCVKKEKDCKAEAPKSESGEDGFFYVWDEVQSRYWFHKDGEYRDPSSSKTLTWINENLTEVSSTMKQTIDVPSKRRVNLDTIREKDSVLWSSSVQFKENARKLSSMTVLNKFSIHSLISLSVLFVLWLRFSPVVGAALSPVVGAAQT